MAVANWRQWATAADTAFSRWMTSPTAAAAASPAVVVSVVVVVVVVVVGRVNRSKTSLNSARNNSPLLS
jgi:hypothetical protein